MNRFVYLGKSRYCPVCKNHFRKFLPDGGQDDRRCPVCESLERQRLIWMYLKTKTSFFQGKKIRLLHIGPPRCFMDQLSKLSHLEYIAADLKSPLASVHFDITSMPFRDESFDAILCNHVLEHIPDDHKAMTELHRVLKNDGWAILQVPMGGEKTFEDPTITSPEERKKYFGLEDHVRLYGKDYYTRLEKAGFKVSVIDFAPEFSQEERTCFGLLQDESICYCTKQTD